MKNITVDSIKVLANFLGIGAELKLSFDSNAEKAAAWEMYVELATRITTVQLHSNEGFLREAMDSMYSLFGITREILRKHGSALDSKKGQITFAMLSIEVLNKVIRPILAKYHPELEDWEKKRAPGVSIHAHELAWEKNAEFREKLKAVRERLVIFANILGDSAGAVNLIEK